MEDRDPSSPANEHPLHDLVGLIDAEQASRVRERVERFRERLDEEVRL